MDIVQNCEVTGVRRAGDRVVGVETSRGFIAAKKVGVVAAGHTSVVMAMAGLWMPLESTVLQALVSEPVKPGVPCVVMSSTIHAYISQSDKGELVIGAGSDQYNSYSQRGSFQIVEHTLEAITELFPIFSRMRMLRHWGGIVDVTTDRSPIVGKTPLWGLHVNCGWGTGGFKATPGSGHVFAHTIARGEPHPINASFSLDRFTTGRLIDEAAVGGRGRPAPRRRRRSAQGRGRAWRHDPAGLRGRRHGRARPCPPRPGRDGPRRRHARGRRGAGARLRRPAGVRRLEPDHRPARAGPLPHDHDHRRRGPGAGVAGGVAADRVARSSGLLHLRHRAVGGAGRGRAEGARSWPPSAPNVDLAGGAFPHLAWREGRAAGVPARVFRISFSGELAYEVNVPWGYGASLWEALREPGRPFGVAAYGTEAMHVLRAEKGYIIVGQDTDGTVTPGDLGMDWIVGKAKRDFLGKRGLARSDVAAPGRKQLVGLSTVDPNEVLEEDAQIVAGPELTRPPVPAIGHVTSSYPSPTLGRSIALALVRGGHGLYGQKVYVPMPGGRVIAAEVAAPLFYDPEGARLHG